MDFNNITKVMMRTITIVILLMNAMVMLRIITTVKWRMKIVLMLKMNTADFDHAGDDEADSTTKFDSSDQAPSPATAFPSTLPTPFDKRASVHTPCSASPPTP